MEIRYIRKLMTSHMVIEQNVCLSEWEEKMIAYAPLSGIMYADCICEDGKCSLWYDITGKQALDIVLEGQSLDYNLLCRILIGIYEAAESLDGVLLSAENMLLLPESIFLDYEMEKIYFCYYPQNDRKIEENFLRLMEYLLTKLAHEDEKAVELAYGIYEQAGRNGWSLRQLKKMILLSYQAEVQTMEMQMPAALERGADEIEEYISEEKTSGNKDTFWRKSVQQIQNFLREHLLQEIHLPFQKRTGAKTPNADEESFVFEPDEETEEAVVSRPTVLLTQLNKQIEGILRYEGTGSCENLTIEGDEFLIGSDRMCAGHIPSDTVSRKHAKISRIGDVYMIEDLNSSNGTYVGGELLNCRTKISLQKNEIVIFADEKFRFI